MKFSYLAILALSSLCAVTTYGQTPAKNTVSEPTEITQIKITRDDKGDRKVTNTIAFSVKSGYKPGTILDFSLAAVVETLSGSKSIQVAKESDEIKDKKFVGKISPKMILPPGRYYLTILPSSNQKNKMSFSNEEQLRLSVSKYLVIGTIAERLEFMKKEYQIASGYLQELDAVYKEFQKILDKSKEDKKPPADDSTFQKWQKNSLNKVDDIDAKIAVQMREQAYLTFYTNSFSKLHELTALLQNQLKQFNRTVILANKNKETSFSFTINSQMPRLISDIWSFLTKETLLDLDWIYYALVEDTVVAYETIKDSPDASKDWSAQETICDEYYTKSDNFIAGFKPPVPDIWKKNIGKIGESRKVSSEIKSAYSQNIKGDKGEALAKKLEELKKSIGEIIYTLRDELKK